MEITQPLKSQKNLGIDLALHAINRQILMKLDGNM